MCAARENLARRRRRAWSARCCRTTPLPRRNAATRVAAVEAFVLRLFAADCLTPTPSVAQKAEAARNPFCLGEGSREEGACCVQRSDRRPSRPAGGRNPTKRGFTLERSGLGVGVRGLDAARNRDCGARRVAGPGARPLDARAPAHGSHLGQPPPGGRASASGRATERRRRRREYATDAVDGPRATGRQRRHRNVVTPTRAPPARALSRRARRR